MSSLANVPNAVTGLSIAELTAYLAEPGRDLSRLRTDVLEKLATTAWYLHSDRDGKLFFKNVQNLNAKLEEMVGAYNREQAIKELRIHLDKLFAMEKGWCYQKVLSLPAVDEIELEQDRVTLVITEPNPGGGLRSELDALFKNATFKNRIAYLTGSRNTYEVLIDTGKRLKAIQHILDDLRLPDSDPQMVKAKDLSDRIHGNFTQAVRETFTTLWYPIEFNGSNELVSADFSMRFEGNRYSGEQQIIDLLKEKGKFEIEVASDMFRRKCEQRLFTQQSMLWSEIKRRAAILCKWQWHIPRALDDLKQDCVSKDYWREQGGYIDKGPFPKPDTDVAIQEIRRDDDTGEAYLKVTPLHGDTIYYDIGAEATVASQKLDGNTLTTKELRVSFLTVDSSREHKTGMPREWNNRITLKYRIYGDNQQKKVELQAAPEAKIRYTTNGSDPKSSGAAYDGPFAVPKPSSLVLAYAERDGIGSVVESINIIWDQDIDFQIDPRKPVSWSEPFLKSSTKESYEFLQQAHQAQAEFSGITVSINGSDGNQEWIQFSMSDGKRITPALLEETINALRKVQGNGQVVLEVDSMHFRSGQDLLDLAEELKVTLTGDKVKQR
jgi:hypothetical protein